MPDLLGALGRDPMREVPAAHLDGSVDQLPERVDEAHLQAAPREQQQRHRQAVLRALAGLALAADAAPVCDATGGESGGGPLAGFVKHPDVGSDRAVDVGQAQAAKERDRDHFARDEERDVQPCGLRFHRLRDPRRPDSDACQQDQRQDECHWQEGAGRFRHPLQGASPAGGCGLQQCGEHHSRLGQAREEENVHEQRLPGAARIVQQDIGDEGERTGPRSGQKRVLQLRRRHIWGR